MRWLSMLLALAAGCASTSYLVEPPPLEQARARGDYHALVPAQRSGSGAPVFVEAGAVHDDGQGRAHIVNRILVTSYVFLGVGALHLVPGVLVLATMSSSNSSSGCSGNDACGSGWTTLIGGTVVGFGVLFVAIGGVLAIAGSVVHPHEWRRGPSRAAYLGPDGALHF